MSPNFLTQLHRYMCGHVLSPQTKGFLPPGQVDRLLGVSDVWDRPDVCSEMSESLIICSKSTKFVRGWLLVSGFAGRVGCFALPSSCEFEVCESGSQWFPLPNCKISTASSVPFDDLSLFPPLSTAPLPRPLRFRVFRPPGIIKINHRCLLRISNYADCFFDNFVGLSRILFGTEKVVAHISCADGYCAAA